MKVNRKIQFIILITSWLLVGSVVSAAIITTIAGTDTLSASRTTINNNFANLNTDKLETNILSDYTSAVVIQLNSATAFRVMNTSSTSALIIDSQKGSTTIASNLTLSSFYASSTGRFTGLLSADGGIWSSASSSFLGIYNSGNATTSLSHYIGGNLSVLASSTFSNLLNIGGNLNVYGNTNFTGTANVIGTITSGTWNGSAIGTQYGGLGGAFNTSSGFFFNQGGTISSTGTAPFTVGFLNATSTTASNFIGGFLSVGTSTFSNIGLLTLQGTTYLGGSLGIGTTSPTYGLVVGNPNLTGSASSSPLAPECAFTVTGTFTIDMSQCVNSRVLAVGAVTLGFSNMRPGAAGSVTWCNDSTGGRTFTPDNSMLFMSGTNFVASSSGLTQTANRCNLIGYKVSNATGTVKALMIPTDAF